MRLFFLHLFLIDSLTALTKNLKQKIMILFDCFAKKIVRLQSTTFFT